MAHSSCPKLQKKYYIHAKYIIDIALSYSFFLTIHKMQIVLDIAMGYMHWNKSNEGLNELNAFLVCVI